MKRIVHPPSFTDKPEAVVTPPASEISVQRLIDDGLVVLYREIKQLMMSSAKGKLDPNNAKDLRDHIKLLFELKEREDASLKNLTDEQIKDKAREALSDDK